MRKTEVLWVSIAAGLALYLWWRGDGVAKLTRGCTGNCGDKSGYFSDVL